MPISLSIQRPDRAASGALWMISASRTMARATAASAAAISAMALSVVVSSVLPVEAAAQSAKRSSAHQSRFKPDHRFRQPEQNSATLVSYALGPVGGTCSGLLDIRFTLRNGSKRIENTTATVVMLDEKLHLRLYSQYLGEALRARRPDLTDAGSALSLLFPQTAEPPAKNAGPAASDSEASTTALMAAADADADRKLDAYTQTRMNAVARDFVERPDTKIEGAWPRLVTVNDGLGPHYRAQLTPETCYAASLETAFRYLKMRGGHADFVARRGGICPGMASGTGKASYSEILAAALSTALDEQTSPFLWTLPEQSQLKLKRRAFRQETLYGQTASAGATSYWVGPDSGFGRRLWHSLGLPSFFFADEASGTHIQFGPPLVSQPGPTLPEIESGELLDAHGNRIDLWSERSWHRKQDPSIGGHIRPLRNSGDLIAALLQGKAVMVGLEGEKGGHTVLVTGLRYTPQFLLYQDSIYFTDQSLIRDVRVLDPDSQTPEYWLGDPDRFFAEYRFGFAIQDGIVSR